MKFPLHLRRWWKGRHPTLKMSCPGGRAGSSPALRTKICNMKLRKGDLVYSAKFERVFTITGKRTEFDFVTTWGEIDRKGQLSYNTVDKDDEHRFGFETVQYIPNVGDVLVNSDGATRIVKELSSNTLIIIGVNHYGDYSSTLVEFKDLCNYTILCNFKLG